MSRKIFKAKANFALAVLIVGGLFVGCEKSVPPSVPVQVTVKTKDGQPINFLKVRFVPTTEGLDGNFIASGVTDDAGTCELKMPGKSDSGVSVGEHKVQIFDASISDDAREAYMSGDSSVADREQRLRKHRPINDKYTRLSTTPLQFIVSADQPTIEIVLE
jgi:hypothetical protein